MLRFGLRQLTHFVAIAEAGSYREAAERTHTAQPALSVSIRKLEEALGVRVFERGPRGVTLTPGGEAFLVEARLSLAHAEQGVQEARLAALGEWGVVRLGFVGSAAYRLLPRTLPGFIARYPGVRLELSEGATVNIVEMVRDGRLDVGIVRTPLDEASGLRIVDVEKDDLIAVLPTTHRLAARKRIDLAALRDESFVMFSKTQVPGLRAAVVDACREAGFAPRVAQEATQALTVVGLVGSGLGVALVPGVIASFTTEQATFVRLSGTKTTRCLTVSLATRQDGASAAVIKLCEMIAGTKTAGADARSA